MKGLHCSDYVTLEKLKKKKKGFNFDGLNITRLMSLSRYMLSVVISVQGLIKLPSMQFECIFETVMTRVCNPMIHRCPIEILLAYRVQEVAILAG